MATATTPKLKFANYLWNDERAQALTPAHRLVYRSNLLGSDQRITNTGGGNTSAKLTEPDPISGEPVEVLWVKGSGGDLRTSSLANFASLYQEKLLSLRKLYASMERRPTRPISDARPGGFTAGGGPISARAHARSGACRGEAQNSNNGAETRLQWKSWARVADLAPRCGRCPPRPGPCNGLLAIFFPCRPHRHSSHNNKIARPAILRCAAGLKAAGRPSRR